MKSKTQFPDAPKTSGDAPSPQQALPGMEDLSGEDPSGSLRRSRPDGGVPKPMLKLDSLSISGFKTFVDPTEVRFAGGITAIVGPNGCGKSNLSDAITWVLGEQSAKSLRGSKMQDVIFSGSDKRKAIGMAEVTLTLATEMGMRHSVDGKIEISRRVFREGGSEYRLNGKKARLKEIKDLLMDTGLGIRAYSVIEQGKIGMILSGKPQERRKLLEEAAGITRYKERKRVAEVKLEEALSNLSRLDDIISEVERALRSLKRQASAARRFQAKEREYHELLKQVLLGRWWLLRGRLDSVDGQLAELLNRDAELAATLARGEAQLAEGREALDALARVLAERHQEQADLAATIEGRQEFLKGGRQRAKEMDERLERGRTEAEQRRKQAEDFKLSLGNIDGRTRELIDERDAAAQLVAEDEAKIAAAQKNVEQMTARLESLRRELMGSVASVNQLRSALQKEQVEIEKRTYRLRFLDEERTRLDRQVSEADATLKSIDEKVSASQATLDDEDTRHKDLRFTLDALLRREAELGDERLHLEARLSGLKQRRRILEQLSAEHEERRAALVEKLAEIGIPEPRFLADVATPTAGWADGIDHFLGDLTDAVVLEPGQKALDLARQLSKLDVSGLFLAPLEGREPKDDVEDEALAWSLAEALDLTPEMAAALPPAYLVERAEDASRLAIEHPGTAFISRERLWAMGGVLRVQGEEAAPGLLALQTELHDIRDEIPTLEDNLKRTRETLENLVQERTRHAKEINRLEERIAELRRDIAVAQARRQDASQRRDRFHGEQQKVATEQAEIQSDLEAKKAQRELLTGDLATAEGGHEELTRTFDSAQAEVEVAKEQREALRTAGAGNRGRLDLLEERLDSHNQEAVRVRRQITYSEEQLQIWGQEDDVLQRRIGELGHEMTQAEEALQKALEGRSEAQDKVLAQQRLLDEKREALRVIEEEVQTTRTARDELRQRIEAQRVDQASLRQDREHLSASYRETFKRLLPGTEAPADIPPPTESEAASEAPDQDETMDAAATAEAPSPAVDASNPGEAEGTVEGEGAVEANDQSSGEDEVTDGETEAAVWLEDDVEIPEVEPNQLAELEADLARCKAVVERLGPVNVLAAEEYDEQQERYGFLSTQRADVASSVESLKITILEINEASSARFKETFEQVNKTFAETFTRLFRGGEAHMRLFDEEDLLETGLEIVARPPGKRPQNIMLLSGGEKALTAIALLFALFQTKPSPFCILDEVDAPLDDANVIRFAETLQEMARDTQFLVVTHNKLTMEIASSLYGVTMEERGVSKLVAVEMEEVQPAQALTA